MLMKVAQRTWCKTTAACYGSSDVEALVPDLQARIGGAE